MEIAGNPEDNLVVKAYSLLDKEFHLPLSKFIYISIFPREPDWGGGSSDAAFMLKLLNDHFQLELSEEQLEVYAATLGSGLLSLLKTSRPCRRDRNLFSPIELSLAVTKS